MNLRSNSWGYVERYIYRLFDYDFCILAANATFGIWLASAVGFGTSRQWWTMPLVYCIVITHCAKCPLCHISLFMDHYNTSQPHISMLLTRFICALLVINTGVDEIVICLLNVLYLSRINNEWVSYGCQCPWCITICVRDQCFRVSISVTFRGFGPSQQHTITFNSKIYSSFLEAIQPWH